MKITRTIWAICVAGLIALPGLVEAQTSSFAQVNIAGDFNGFDTLTPNMTLVADHWWQGDLTIPATNFVFKFATPNFAQDWGLNSVPHSSLPLAARAVSQQGDITIENNTGSDQIRFLFNSSTRQFAVFALNNVGNNLLQNSDFSVAGTGNNARYWQAGIPNIHGGVSGGTARGDSSWDPPVPPAPGTFAAILGGWSGQTSGEWWQRVPVEPGLTYEADALFAAEAGWTASNQQLRLEYFDYNFNQVAVFTRDLIGITDTYSRQSIAGVAPNNAAWARLLVEATGVGPSATFRFHDANLQATVARRSEDFNSSSWAGATIDNCYSFSGWQLCTGRTVEIYTFGSVEVPLARSGRAASLSGEGAYIQSPRFQNGIGTITFHYRHGYEGDPDEGPEDSVVLKVQRSFEGVSWTDVATISNIFNTAFVRADVFEFQDVPQFVRITHGGGTNRIIIDDISIAQPTEEPRRMDFVNWPNEGTNVACHTHLNWQVCTGIVSSAFARSGKAAQILGDPNSSSYLMSPNFENGYGTISFSYRRGVSGVNTVGFALEASADDGESWTELDRVENIDSLFWQDYSAFFIDLDPHRIRIRNLYETNVLSNVDQFINEEFDNGSQPPPGWEFSQIGQYDTVASSGNNPPSLAFNQDGSFVITPPLLGPTNVTFMMKGQSISSDSEFTVEALIGGNWTEVATFSNISNGKVEQELALNPATAQLRFIYTKVGGNLAFDDLVITGDGASGGTYQTLVLEDVDIGNPIEHRLQDFNSWPTKNSYNQGVDVHQAWRLVGNVIVNEVDAFEGQSARLRRAGDGSGGAYFVDFEGTGETKASYAAGTVNLSGLNWLMDEALIGALDNDFKEGERSARLRGRNGAVIEMLEDKPNGIGSISFKYRRFGSDGAQQPWAVEYSTDGGESWTQAGSAFTADATVETFSHEVDVSGDARVRIRIDSTPGTTGNRRINIDDIVITDQVTSGGGGEEEGSVGAGDPYILTHRLPEGVGSITFQYRNSAQNPTGNQIGVLLVQSSPDGVVWSNRTTVSVDNDQYQAFGLYLFEPDEEYVRIALTAGNEPVLIDNIHVARPQPRAIVSITGSNNPSNPFVNDDVRLEAIVTPRFGAHSLSVTSYYRIGTSGVFQTLPMENVDGATFQSVDLIPPQPTGTIVQYYMEAWYEGPGADQTRPITYPADGAANLASYGIPRNAPGRVWINEIDYVAQVYDFSGELDWSFTYHEFIELAGLAETDISGWRLELRDGGTTSYLVFDNYVIEDETVIADEHNGFGFYVFGTEDLDPALVDVVLTNLLQTRLPGGAALYNEMGGLEHAVAYDGGVPGYQPMGVSDPDFGTSTESVGLSGVGANSEQFDWTVNPPTPGAPNNSQTFADPAIIAAQPASLSFSYIRNSLDPLPQTIVISNAGVSELTYELISSRSWLSVDPEGPLTLQAGEWATHEVTVEVSGLTGNRSGVITVTGLAENSPFSIPVTLTETVVGDALLEYPMDNNANNQGVLGSAGNLAALGGGTFTIQGAGVSGEIGDFAYVSQTNTARLQSAAAVTGVNNRASFTITGWLRPSVTNGMHYVLGNRASNQGFEIRTSEDYQNLSFISSAGSAATGITSTNGVMPTNTWTFFAITFDSGESGDGAVQFYRGTDENSIFLSSSHAKGDLGPSGVSTEQFRIGGTGADAYEGWIDDVRVFDGVLEPFKIEAVRVEAVDRIGGEGEMPEITSQPQSQTVFLGQEVEFTVAADGLPLPSYQWLKNGEPITGAIDFRYTISSPELSDAADYQVVAFNIIGSVTSQVATLTVNDIPRIVAEPQDIYVYTGASTSIWVEITGHPLPTFRWQRDGQNLFPTTSNIVISSAVVGQSGDYQVTISNEFGVATSRLATVRVQEPGQLWQDGGFMRPGPANRVVIGWASGEGRTFDILYSPNIMDGEGSFVPIVTNLPATPPMNVYTTEVMYGTNREGFFRFRSHPAP